MQSDSPDMTALSTTYAHARRLAPEPQAIVVLHLGDDQAVLAWGTGKQPSLYSSLPLGLTGLAHRLVSNGHLSELAMEHAIAEVEDIVMPLRASLPAAAQLFSEDTVIAELAQWAGMADHTKQWSLTSDSVEHLFNRLVARVQGRPASQDNLPITGLFSAALLFLREWLHHLGFGNIMVLSSQSTR